MDRADRFALPRAAGTDRADPVIDALRRVVAAVDRQALCAEDPAAGIDDLLRSPALDGLLRELLDTDVLDEAFAHGVTATGAIAALAPLRRLRTAPAASLATVVGLIAQAAEPLDADAAARWRHFADGVRRCDAGRVRLRALLHGTGGAAWLSSDAADVDPHALHPTSPYRVSDGHVVSSDGDDVIEAAVTSRTFTSVRIVEDVLDPARRVLADVYGPHGRCVAFVDANVAALHGVRLDRYFAVHGIGLDQLVYRAMEVDKGIATVERMLGDLKRLGVRRDEPVLIVGGGVLADTAGLACALYHRSTPYVVLSTSLVAGVDAGPSPRTCCDGFGYKNLFGAYHPPALAITDRTMLSTLREGWLRHGVAEIVKMAVVADAPLFAMLEAAGPDLVDTRFGTGPGRRSAELAQPSRRILGAAIRSYLSAEYPNLTETHQQRPHAYGHTWSPGFEIAAGLLHGHAVSIGMGLGALLSHRHGWLDAAQLHRILRLISSFGLALWHDVLDDRALLHAAQDKIEQKRGGQLVAPVPRGGIGRCGYLDDLRPADLDAAVDAYRALVDAYPRAGRGIEPLCADVGLEDPSTVGGATLDTAAVGRVAVDGAGVDGATATAPAA